MANLFVSGPSSIAAKNIAQEATTLFTSVIKKLEESNLTASKVAEKNEAEIIKLEDEKEEMEQLIVSNAVIINNLRSLGIK